MEKDFWNKKWALNDIGFNQQVPNTLLTRYFNRLNWQRRARIFVPLCGKSIDMAWLLSQGYQVMGVELSDLACEAFFLENQLAWTERKTNSFKVYEGCGIQIFSGDFFELTPELMGPIDGVFDRAALVALPPVMRRQYVHHLLTLLSLRQPIFLIASSYPPEEMAGPPFSLEIDEVKALYGAQYEIECLYESAVRQIPQHLKTRGLSHLIERAYWLR